MQSLHRFWHWQRNENPHPGHAGLMLDKNLSPLARYSVAQAQELIARRALPKNQQDWSALMPVLEQLSLSICKALARVPERSPHEREEPLELVDEQ